MSAIVGVAVLVIARSADGRSNVAVTDFAVSTVTTHEPVPEHPAPDQLAKVDPLAEIASNVTTVPGAKAKAHVPPQLIPLGVLMTVPVPVPAFVTVNVWLRGTVTVNEAKAATLLGSVKLMVTTAWIRYPRRSVSTRTYR